MTDFLKGIKIHDICSGEVIYKGVKLGAVTIRTVSIEAARKLEIEIAKLLETTK